MSAAGNKIWKKKLEQKHAQIEREVHWFKLPVRGKQRSEGSEAKTLTARPVSEHATKGSWSNRKRLSRRADSWSRAQCDARDQAMTRTRRWNWGAARHGQSDVRKDSENATLTKLQHARWRMSERVRSGEADAATERAR